jgi:hypothetical protein
LSLNELTEFSDCVLPVDNQALIDIVNLTTKTTSGSNNGSSGSSKQITAEALVNRDISKRPMVTGSVLDTHDKQVRLARKKHAQEAAAAAAAGADEDDMDDERRGDAQADSGSAKPTTTVAAAASGVGDGSKPFDQMNTIAAHLLTNLTCSMRYVLSWGVCCFIT